MTHARLFRTDGLLRGLLVSSAASVLFSSAVASDVIRVGPTRPVATIAEGILLADADTVLLVDPAVYVEDVTISEGIALVADGNARVVGELRIDGVGPNRTVLFTGITFELPFAACTPPVTVRATSCRAPIHFQDCEILGADAAGCLSSSPAARFESCFDVVFDACSIAGDDGDTAGAFAQSQSGGGAIVARDTAITISDCSLVGGRGRFGFFSGDGGVGLALQGTSRTFLHGGSIVGGDAGDSFDIQAGNGGAGVLVGDAASVFVQRTSIEGGLGGTGSAVVIGGEDADPIEGNLAGVSEDPDAPRGLAADTLVPSLLPWSFRITELDPGESVEVIVARGTGFRPIPALERPLLVRFPAPGAVLFPPSTTEPGGSILFPQGPTPPPNGDDALVVWLQALCTDSSGARRLSAARVVVILADGV
ncbi:MAG: hypothetical protein AAGB93_16750 [Planctomycetota bacterium]